MSKTNSLKGALSGGTAMFVLGLALLSSPAAAQTQADDSTELAEAEIVVTGSRIVRPYLEQASPIQTLGSEEIRLKGAANVEDVLYDLPSVVPTMTAASNNPGEGVATVDLRGLGPTRTLVLVNGRRYVSYDEQQIVDLNSIPAALIERVDVVTGGRSAVYGSDAIGGVVNFILKNDFEGAQLSSQYRVSQRGDAQIFTTDGLIGGNFADGRGNATLSVGYLKRKATLASARGFSRNALVDDGEGGVFFGGSSSIEGTRFTPAGTDTGSIRFTPGGNFAPYNANTDQYNYAPTNYLQTPQERWLVSGNARYEVSDALEFFAEAQFINTRVNSQLAPSPIVSGQSGTLFLSASNPFLSPAAQAYLTGIDATQEDVIGNSGSVVDVAGNGIVAGSFDRRFSEAGARFQSDDRTAYRAVLGARGDIGSDWHYEGYYSYARNRNVQSQTGNVSISRFNQAIGNPGEAAILAGTADFTPCANAPAGCVPLNIFGPGTASPEAVAFVTVPTTNINTITEQVANVTFSNGNLFDLGAGPAGVAIGAEWRSESGSYRPDFSLASGDVVGFNAGSPTVGHYSVKEVFAEVALPLLADRPFAQRLELNGAARYSDYSNAVGSVWTYAGGAQYSPIKDITFRGQYQRAIRAPTVSQLFLGGSVGFPLASDPCEQTAATTNANLQASCIAAGVPAANLGTAFGGGNSQIQTLFGGNTDLREEKADTYTVGVVLAPTIVPNFSITVDYYNIKIEDYIGSAGPGASNIIAACYGDVASNYVPYDTSYCSLLPRQPGDRALVNIVNTNANLGELKTEGVDFELRYGRTLGFGFFGTEESKIDFRFTGTRLINWQLLPIASVPELVNECTGRFGNICGNVFPKWRWSSRLTFNTGPVTTSFAWQHVGAARDDDDSVVYYRERFKAANYFDLSFGVQASERLNLTFGAENLFDRQPQLAGDNQEQTNTFPSTYDVYGRRFFIGATMNF